MISCCSKLTKKFQIRRNQIEKSAVIHSIQLKLKTTGHYWNGKGKILSRGSNYHVHSWLHYNDLFLCCTFLKLNLLHHLHMLLSGNLWLSMASLVICMHIRFLLNEIQKQYYKHMTYRLDYSTTLH